MKWKKLILIFVLILILGSGIYFLINYFSGEDNKLEIQGSLPLKIGIKEDGEFKRVLQVKNDKDYKRHFDVFFDGLENLAFLDTDGFDLEPGETKSLNFSISNKENLKEGVYLGALNILSEESGQKKPIILEIESADVLFDGSVEMYPIDNVAPGEEISPRIKIYDLSNIGTSKVKVNYFIKDFSEEESIFYETEDVIVKEKTEVTKTVSLPEIMKEDTYVFGLTIKYKNSIATASSIFTVSRKKEAGILDTNVLYFIVSLAFILLLFVIFVFYSIYSRDKLLGVLKRQYQKETRRQKKLIGEERKRGYAKLKTPAEKRVYRRELDKVVEKRLNALEGMHSKRLAEYSRIKTKFRKKEVENQVRKWEKEGYDTRLFNKKYRLPDAIEIRRKLNRQELALEEAKKEGIVSSSSYKKAKTRIQSAKRRVRG